MKVWSRPIPSVFIGNNIHQPTSGSDILHFIKGRSLQRRMIIDAAVTLLALRLVRWIALQGGVSRSVLQTKSKESNVSMTKRCLSPFEAFDNYLVPISRQRKSIDDRSTEMSLPLPREKRVKRMNTSSVRIKGEHQISHSRNISRGPLRKNSVIREMVQRAHTQQLGALGREVEEQEECV